MFSADLAFPFTLGLVAAFNPCGFAMLPVYVSFFLGKDTDTSTARNIMRALKVGLALTAGFVAVFGAFGILTSSLLSSGSVLSVTPYITFGLGFLLIPFGFAMLKGFELKLGTPKLQKGGDSGEIKSMFLFGVSYAVVSLGCTVGLFIAGVSNVFASGGFIDGVSVFVAYGLGMGAVIMTLTVALALAKTSIATNMRKILPWVNRISGVLLALSGAYLIVYGWWEIQVLRGNIQQNSLVSFFENMQTQVNIWINETGATRLGAALLLLVGAALIRGMWSEMNKQTRYGALGGLGLAWVLLEFVQSWNGERANLFVLPLIRTIIGFPARIGNWFSDPLRWAVLGELFILGIIGIAIYFRFFRKNEAELAIWTVELKYKPAVGGVMLVIGLANLVLAAAAGATVAIFTGLILTVLGILMLTKSPVGLSPQSIAMRNLLGMELKRHHLAPGNFEVRDNKIFVGGKKRVSLWLFDTDEQTVRNYLNGRD